LIDNREGRIGRGRHASSDPRLRLKGPRRIMRLIDVWDVATFDQELVSFLEDHADLLRSYWTEDKRLFDERERQTLRGPPQHNAYGPAFSALKEEATTLMGDRTIRTWHFTRLTDAEVADVRARGMVPMHSDHIRQRLDALVDAELLAPPMADTLFAASPYHAQLQRNREGRIWLTGQPYPLDDSGVVELVTAWGGESVNFVHRRGAIRELLMAIGRPRVIEVALPLAITTRADSAANNILDAYAASIGPCGGWGGGSDMVAVQPISPYQIIAVHSPGDPSYEQIGRGYPERFVAKD